MIVRSLSEIKGTDREICDNNWTSARLLLEKDGMGFSFHITTIYADSEIEIQYLNHLESVYCIRGKGSITDLKTNQTYTITPGTVYALNENDKHILRAEEELELACVFNPPCIGNEVHDETGAYPIAETVNTLTWD